MRLVVEGPKTNKLVEEVQQVMAQSAAEFAVLQVKIGGLHSKIEVLSEWLGGESPIFVGGLFE